MNEIDTLTHFLIRHRNKNGCRNRRIYIIMPFIYIVHVHIEPTHEIKQKG